VILIVIIKLIVYKNWTNHWSGNLESERTVNLPNRAFVIILHSNFLDVVGKYKHRYTYSYKDGRHNEKKSDGFGESGYG
jgi:hypothetical protein